MVEQQIRTWEVLDDKVLDLYYQLPRDAFTHDNYTSLAFADLQLPIGHSQCMLEPKVEARMLQNLAAGAAEKILHIGTGSGFFAALLSKMAKQVVSWEIIPELAEQARLKLDQHHIGNCEVITGDGLAQAAVENTKYDAAVLTGSIQRMPDNFFERLTLHGRVLTPVGVAPVCCVKMFERAGTATTSEDLFDTWIPPLTNGPHIDRFSF